MKSKIILISICLLFITNAFSQETFYYIKGEKNYLTNISTKEILLEFVEETGIFDKNSVITDVNDVVNLYSGKGDILKELSLEKQQGSCDRYIMKIRDNSEKNEVNLLINTLRDNGNIRYVNNFYNKGEYRMSYSDEVILKFKDIYDDSFKFNKINELSEKFQFQVINQNEYIKNIFIVKTDIDATILSQYLYESKYFEWVEPNICYLTKRQTNTTTKNSKTEQTPWAIQFMNVDDAWAITKGSPTIKIAVLDNGVDLDHPDLDNNILTDENFPWDIIAYDAFNEGWWVEVGSYGEDDSHGTMCAGCIGAEENGSGVIGVAPRCKIIPVRMNRSYEMDDFYEIWSENTAEAIQWSVYTANADVLSLSWGVLCSENETNQYIEDMIDHVNEYGRGDKGLPVIVASGNESDECGLNIDFPANLSSTIAVGAIDQTGNRTAFSNYYGGTLDVVAPGTGIITTTIDGAYTNPNYTEGTSFSTPYIAGVFALMYSVEPDLTYAQAKEYLLTNCIRNTDNYDWEDKTPYGLWNEQLGYGYPDVNEILSKIEDDPSWNELNISITNSIVEPNTPVSFTATCDNATGDVNYIWSISRVEGNLDGPCSSTDEGCYQENINPSAPIEFPEEGYYYVYVWGQDDETYAQGSTYKIINVSEHVDPCIVPYFISPNEECEQSLNVSGEEYQIGPGSSFYYCENNSYPDVDIYEGIKAMELLVNGERYYFEEKDYISFNWDNIQCINTAEHFNVGENIITLKAWAGYRPDPLLADLDYVNIDNAYTQISKKINFIDTETTLPITQSILPVLNMFNNTTWGNVYLNPNNENISLTGSWINPFMLSVYNSAIIGSQTIIKPSNEGFVLKTLGLPVNCSCVTKNADFTTNINLLSSNKNDKGLQNKKYIGDKKNKSTTFVIEKPENNKTTEIEEPSIIDDGFSVIPNPFEHTFELIFSKDINPNRIEIVNISGKLVYFENISDKMNKTVKTNTFSKGVYFVRLYTDKGILFKKIVKQ